MKPDRSAIRRIARAGQSHHDRGYAAIKMRTDPAYGAVLDHVKGSDLPILDVGCGMGLLAFYLRAAGVESAVVGLDFDSRKIDAARKMQAQLGIEQARFLDGDATTDLPPHQGHVVILDILQFFPEEERAKVLRAAVERVAPGGCLLIRSGLVADSLRFRITAWVDQLSVLASWMKSSPVSYPTREEFEKVLGEALEVEVRPLWGRTPFNNHLIVARKPAPAAAS